ncbi:MAG: hypothetical protein H6550_00805 [Chitinophagales bacterium]|nr:hypothetical protein [Chitinophagales bacterium]
MKIDRLLPSIFLSLYLLSSCNERVEETTSPLEDNYEQRIVNTNRLLQDYHIALNADSATIYIIQVEKCNVCNETSFANIKADAQKNLNKKVFILSDTSNSIQAHIQQDICKENCTIVTDDMKKIPRYGLSLMRNIKIAYVNNTIYFWEFL